MRITRPMERSVMRVRVRVCRSDPKTVRIWKRNASVSRWRAVTGRIGSIGVMDCLLLRCWYKL